MGQKNNLEQFIEESISNIRDDRDTVKFLLTDLLAEITKQGHSHKEVGIIAAKYVETLQRSNEQLVKLTSLIQKNSKGTDGLTAEDKRDLFDLINGSDEDRETG
jgi:uncharacterized protein YeeX (DUF496 family)